MEATPTTATHTALRDALTTLRTPLDVVVSYLLSEAGRKASLLAGGDGRATQEVTIPVSRSRLHLVSVDPRGVARLRLRPRFELDAQRQRVLQVNTPPEYDSVPSPEELLADASRNHELARRFYDEQTANATVREAAERDIKTQLAAEFLADASRRAIPYPAPTRKQCRLQIEGSRRRVLFDASTDSGQLAQVPPEAHRRFRTDLQVRRDRSRQLQTEQRTVHEQKAAQIAEWIEMHGTEDQRARQTLGVLPFDEAVDAMTSAFLHGLEQFLRYRRDGVDQLQEALRLRPGHPPASLSTKDIVVTSSDARTVSKAQWEQMSRMKAAVPEGFTVTLRTHRISLRSDPRAPSVATASIVVVGRVGLLTLRREYAVEA